jgi:putative endonuclease
VARRLEEDGARILARNVREGNAEIDIVALDRGTLAIVEVKFRSGSRFGDGAESIDRRKRARLRAAAAAYRARAFPKGVRPPPVRFDVAIVTPGAAGTLDVEIVRAAFE